MQLRTNFPENSCFMRNCNHKCEEWIQNIDEGIISTFSIELAKRLDNSGAKKLTIKSFYRSAYTQLSEASISIIGLCKARN